MQSSTNLREINLNVNIDYYCFPTKTGDISVFRNFEQYDTLGARMHYKNALKEVIQAEEKEKLILFDFRNNRFINTNGEPVNIEGKVIFPRSTISESDILVENIVKFHGKPITSKEDEITALHWFQKVPTKRQYKMTTLREVLSNIDDYEKNFGKQLFIKTVQRGFSGIATILKLPCQNTELLDYHFHSISMSVNLDADILIYKPLEILDDKFGNREWRAFVLYDQLLSLSRASNDIVPVEEYIDKKVKEQIKELRGIMPSSYVIDFFEYKEDDGTIFDIVECNPIIASRAFANNHLIFYNNPRVEPVDFHIGL